MKSGSFLKLLLPSVAAIAVIGFTYTKLHNENTPKEQELAEKSSDQLTQGNYSNTSSSINFSKILDNNEFVDTVDKRLQQVSNRSDLGSYDAEDILSAVNSPKVWDFNENVSPEDLPLDSTEVTDGRKFFRASPARVAVSLPGDILEVYVPDMEEPLHLTVEQVASPANGLVKLKGTLKNMDGTFNMSQGNNLVAGHINTPTNTYSFEMFGNTGWIHESGALFTGELPPIVDEGFGEHAGHQHSQLGSKGEHILARGNPNRTTTGKHENSVQQSSIEEAEE